MNSKSPKALIVSEDSGLRETVGRWLEDDGIEVLTCPGPRAPHFSCIGLRCSPCPLLGDADVVVLDLHPEPGQLADRTGRVALVKLYRENLRPVLVMADETGTALPDVDGVAVVGRLADPASLVPTVRELLSQATG